MKLSVNIITHNRADLLHRAIDSAFSQWKEEYELVVVNDGSTDNTQNVVDQYRDRIKNLVYLENEISKGVGFCRQLALKNSSGIYIAVLDDDDTWIYPNKLSDQIAFLDANPEVGIVGSSIEIDYVDDGTRKILKANPDDGTLRRQMLYKAPFINSSTMFRRELAISVGGYDEHLKVSEEFSLWLKLGRLAKMANLMEVTTLYSVHSKGLTINNTTQILKSSIKLAFQFRNDYPGAVFAVIKNSIQYFFILIFGIGNWQKLKHFINR